MKKTLFIAVITLCLVGKSFACLNGEMLKLWDGSFLYMDYNNATPQGHNFRERSRADLQRTVARLDSLYRINEDIRILSDEGLVLIVLGEYKKAISLYQEIEMTEPNRYSTASNIGTAYELDGQNKKALFWIEKALSLDPQSHNGSEWIHVNILKAKINGEPFTNSKFLLNTDFGTDSIPRTDLRLKALDSLSSALYYQLNERISFVKPKDKIVGQLLFDLANITFLRGQYRVAIADYVLAREYGYSDDKLLNLRLATCNAYSKQSKSISVPNIVYKKSNTRTYVYAGLGAVIGIILAFIVWKRKAAGNVA